jgi:tetratricopeptide (TPR) repeat protein
MKTISILLMLLFGVINANAQTPKDDKYLTIGFIVKEVGDSAVIFATKLLAADNQSPINHYLASNAYKVLFGASQSPNAKEKSIEHMSLADTLLRATKPDSTFYLNALASKHEEFGDSAQALQIYQKSISINRNQKDVYQHLLLQRLRSGQLDEVVPYFENILMHTHYTREDVLSYIDVLLSSNRNEAALDVIKRFSGEFANDLTILYQQLKANYQLNVFQHAAAGCREIQRIMAEDNLENQQTQNEFSRAEFYYVCGQSYLNTGDIRPGIESMSKAVQLDTTRRQYFAERFAEIIEQYPSLYYESYAVHKYAEQKRQGDSRKALRTIQEFEQQVAKIRNIMNEYAATLETNATMLDSLGNLYTDIGDYINARNTFLQLNRVSPSAGTKLKLASVVYLLGDYHEAKFYLDHLDGNERRAQSDVLAIMILLQQSKTDQSQCPRLRARVRALNWEALSREDRTNLCQILIENPCITDLTSYCESK